MSLHWIALGHPTPAPDTVDTGVAQYQLDPAAFAAWARCRPMPRPQAALLADLAASAPTQRPLPTLYWWRAAGLACEWPPRLTLGYGPRWTTLGCWLPPVALPGLPAGLLPLPTLYAWWRTAHPAPAPDSFDPQQFAWLAAGAWLADLRPPEALTPDLALAETDWTRGALG